MIEPEIVPEYHYFIQSHDDAGGTVRNVLVMRRSEAGDEERLTSTGTWRHVAPFDNPPPTFRIPIEDADVVRLLLVEELYP